MKQHKERESYLQNRLLINCSILSLLFFINCFVGQMVYVIYPIVFLLILLDDRKTGFSYLIFCIPYTALTIYMGSILYGACVALYIIKFYIMLYVKDRARPNWFVLAVIAVFLIYCMMPMGAYNNAKFIKTGVFLGLFAVFGMLIKKPDTIDFHTNIRVLAISLIISCVFGFTWWISPYLQQTQELFIMDNGHSRFQALLTQPNVLAMMCEAVIAFLAYYIISGQFKKRDLIWFTLTAIAGVMTMSKTYLIILLFVLFVMFVWSLFKRPIKTVIAAGIIASLICVALIVNVNFAINFFRRFGSGFSKITDLKVLIGMITTGRSELWLAYLIFIAKNPLVLVFGQGLGAGRVSFSSVHNAYIAMIYELGIVGALLLALVIIAMIIEFKKQKTKRVGKSIWIPIVVICLLCLVEDVIFFIY